MTCWYCEAPGTSRCRVSGNEFYACGDITHAYGWMVLFVWSQEVSA